MVYPHSVVSNPNVETRWGILERRKQHGDTRSTRYSVSFNARRAVSTHWGGTANFVVGMKEALSESGAAMGNGDSWEDCDRRAWCNNDFKNAIPETIRPIFKEMQTVTGSSYTDISTPLISNDYFALLNCKEVTGTSRVSAEGSSIYLEYFTNVSNRSKGAYWHTRTFYSDRGGKWNVQISPTGSITGAGATAPCDIITFGCI